VYQAIVPANGQMQFYSIQLSSAPPSSSTYITGIRASGGIITLDFTGPSSSAPSAFTVLSGSVVSGITNVVGAATISGSGGAFQATFPATGRMEFYRIQMGSAASTIYITRVRVSGGVATLDFTGPSSALPSAFTVLSGSAPTGLTNVAASAVSGSNGVYEATVPATSPRQFYRIQK
jgi:hypothetical protein